MTANRRIAIYTGNRAEYGLQYPIIKAVAEHPDLDYFLLVSGAHLDEAFGRTKNEIEKDGFQVHAEVPLEMGDDLYGTAHAIGTGILGTSAVLRDLAPDVLVVYADRFEGFAALVAGTQMGIPTAHIEGGDITEGGALDDSVRHAMTKLAHLHFTTNEEAAERVRRLGEEPWRVHNVGFPALDLIKEDNYAGPEVVRERLGLETGRPVVVFTQHSVATEFEQAVDQVRPSLEAMRRLAGEGYQIILTYPNNDAGGKRIIQELDSQRGLDGIQVHSSLGRWLYHGVLNLCGRDGPGACVGNSSSGIKETPVFGCPFVNVGSRQAGRLRGGNVLDAAYDAQDIYQKVRKACEDKAFRLHCAEAENPYYAGGAGPRIAQVLADTPLDARLVQKKMTY